MKQLPPLHLACLDDDMRPNFKFIQIKNGIAQASNGHMIVKIMLNETTTLDEEQIETLNGKFIHMECWNELHKSEMLEFTQESITCWNKGIKKTYEYGQPNGEFFNLDGVVLQVKEHGEEPKRIIAYTPKLIAIIQKIFDADQLIFSFTKGKSGSVVFPSENSGMFAILMPIDISTANRYLFLT